MLKAIIDKNKKPTLTWPPAKIVPIQSSNTNIQKQNENSTIPRDGVEEKKEKNCNIKFCEPVFKPRKHEFL